MSKVLAILILSYMIAWTAQGAENRWTDVNADPYRGSTEAAIQAMTRANLSAEAVGPVTACFRDKKWRPGEIRIGGTGVAMVYGSKALKLMPGVQYQWKEFTGLKTEDCEYGEYVIRRAVICNNFLLERKPKAAVAPPPPPVPKPEPRPASPLDVAEPFKIKEDHTLYIRIWDTLSAKDGSDIKGILGKLKAVPGSQSQDLGDRLLEAEAKGEIKPYQPCVRFSLAFRNINFEVARGGSIYLSGVLMSVSRNFGPEQNAFHLEQVCGGRTGLTIPRAWILNPERRDSLVMIYSPWRMPDIYYPPSGRLMSPAGNFFEFVTKYSFSHWHFAK